MQILKILSLTVILVTSLACSKQAVRDESHLLSAWQDHATKTLAVDDWDLRGRLSVQTDKEAWSASLNWQHNTPDFHIRLTAPLGQGTFEIYGNHDEVFLRTGEDNIYKSSDPVGLMNDILGWHVPIDGLFYWIRGLPDSKNKIDLFELNNQGQIAELQQSGWYIVYDRYNVYDVYTLPGRIQLHNGKMKLRLAIRDWTI